MKLTAWSFLFMGFLVLSCSNLPLSGNYPLADWYPFADDFTSQSSRWHTEVANSTAITIDNTNIAANNTPKIKVVVAPGDVANNGNRAELAIYNCGQYLDTVYYGFDFLVPSGDPDDFTWQILSQWYQLPDFEHGENFDLQYPHPPIYLALEPGKLVLMGNVPEETRLTDVGISKNTWYRAIVKIHYDIDGDGEVELFLGANPATPTAIGPGSIARATLHNRAGIYWKMGLYRGSVNQTQAKSTNTVYIDNVKIARSFAGVQ